MMERHFVTFYSPGTFVAETDERPIDSWDVEAAREMAREIRQRHNATPYGFRFTTRTRGPEDLDSKVTDSSAMYYLGGTVLTLEELKARNDPTDRILVSNMETNDWARVVINDNSLRWTQPLRDGDVVLDWTPHETEAQA